VYARYLERNAEELAYIQRMLPEPERYDLSLSHPLITDDSDSSALPESHSLSDAQIVCMVKAFRERADQLIAESVGASVQVDISEKQTVEALRIPRRFPFGFWRRRRAA
jgi:hypothetical protein